MDIRQITDNYAVSPQINPSDLPAVAAAGFTTVICNRPDQEVPLSHCSDVMRAAAENAGLAFVFNPVTHAGLSLETISTQKSAVAASTGPALAYCASGNRSSIVWGFAHATEMSADEIITAARGAGYELGGMKAQLTAFASRG